MLVLCVSVVAIALGLVLTGCNEGSSEAPAEAPSFDVAAKENFVGLWELAEMDSDEGSTSTQDIKMMKSYGLTLYIEYEDDHTGAFEVFGQDLDFSWEAKDETSVTMKFSKEALEALQTDEAVVNTEQEATVSEETLTMKSPTATMSFKQIDPKDKVEPIVDAGHAEAPEVEAE